MAVVAAVPGLIDYIYTVPPESSAKTRARTHGLLNSTMLVLFVIAAFYRRQQHAQPLLLLVLELAGVSLMLVAGWMGGTLVHRNQIGVDQRYANAGKWNEAYFDDASNDIAVAATDELKVNAMKLLHINGKRIVLARTENGFAAFDDRCTHKGGSLAGGSMMCGTVQCPWHGSQFSVQNGNVTAGPAKTPIKTYPVSEKNGHVYVAINAS
jgi:nitrite reductase/ring-hydroxylating ferredoxin subunit